MPRCAACELTTAAMHLRGQADTLDALERPEAAARLRSQADTLDAAPCGWWWRRKAVKVDGHGVPLVDPATGENQTEVIEGCGKATLPIYLNDFGWNVEVSAKSVQTATSEALRVRQVAEAVGGELVRLRGEVERHGDRLESATLALGVAGGRVLIGGTGRGGEEGDPAAPKGHARD